MRLRTLNAAWARRLAGGGVLACAAAAALVGWRAQPGHLETFAQFQQQFTGNELWGIQPLATAIPGSDYGQVGTNDPRIRPFVLSWLDHHFAVVFGGDYLDQGRGRPLAIPGRFSPRLSYRMSLGPEDTLRVLHCRLSDFVQRRPIAAERRCSRPSPQPGG